MMFGTCPNVIATVSFTISRAEIVCMAVSLISWNTIALYYEQDQMRVAAKHYEAREPSPTTKCYLT